MNIGLSKSIQRTQKTSNKNEDLGYNHSFPEIHWTFQLGHDLGKYHCTSPGKNHVFHTTNSGGKTTGHYSGFENRHSVGPDLTVIGAESGN